MKATSFCVAYEIRVGRFQARFPPRVQQEATLEFPRGATKLSHSEQAALRVRAMNFVHSKFEIREFRPFEIRDSCAMVSRIAPTSGAVFGWKRDGTP